MNGFPRLENKVFRASIADNSALGAHVAGLNGVAELVLHRSGRSLFVPSSAGLNYEIIALTGLPPFPPTAVSMFEPRSEPMQIREATAERVVLVQPETSHAHVSATIAFRIAEPHYLHQHIELTFHRRFAPPGRPHAFHSLWASYLHAPPDRHVYLRRGAPDAEPLSGWVGITKLNHGPADWHIRPLPDGRELSPAEHLEAMRTRPPEVFGYGPVPPTDPLTLGREVAPGPLSAYYGLHGDALFLMMFRQPERFRFAYSPCGGGTEPAWSPAWDYVLLLEDAELNRPYAWDLCLAVKPYAGRRDVVEEILRYRNESP